MNKRLLIVFVKNIKLGTVKTRLAQSIGDEGAFEVYKYLVELTEKATEQLDADKHIYFSDVIIQEKWPNYKKFVQQGQDLGERMKNAFQYGFSNGYEQIAIIGSDLPEITSDIMNEAFDKLLSNDLVFGPAQDGGYYLMGMNKLVNSVFENKPWSTNELMNVTMKELKNKDVVLLKTMNDLDTVEDLTSSSIADKFAHLV